jgi:dihydroorotate dehydrogenase
MYRLLRPALFRLPPESAHDLATSALRLAATTPPGRTVLGAGVPADPRLAVDAFGIGFPSPVGLAAGFDKGGRAIHGLAALGFGHVEIGTVTAHPQPGNPRPRLFRLPADRALINRMGFNNPGAEAVAARLARTPPGPILGINLGKSRVTPLEEAAADYAASVRALAPFARYLVVNVSSPNTPGLRTLQDPAPLREILGSVQEAARAATAGTGAPPPVLLKIAPDLADADVETVAGVAAESGVAGIIAVNTTISREGLRTPAQRLETIGAGGVSGAPLALRAREVLRVLRGATGGRLPLVSVGGIDSAEEAWLRLEAGASLVQVYTALIYRGPGLVGEMLRGILARMEREGHASLAEVTGTAGA